MVSTAASSSSTAPCNRMIVSLGGGKVGIDASLRQARRCFGGGHADACVRLAMVKLQLVLGKVCKARATRAFANLPSDNRRASRCQGLFSHYREFRLLSPPQSFQKSVHSSRLKSK
jgi:hypothetical protein